ncbi:MATE family efflux transporter [Candidatus Allofournierella merdipullorum]|uniref:MATE family efflux transporter n=1 Tax=Candidatus Allofournierella merdipullorum TaxID=2838595 RepID=UPI003AB459EE
MMHNEPSAAIRGQFWRYALPSMFSQLLNSCFIIVDGLFIGRNLGDAGLAAINVAWPIVALIQAVSLAVGTGGAVRLATALGKGDEDEALTARGNAVLLLAASAVALGVGLGLTYPYILPLIGANEELYPLAAAYIRVVCLLTVCQVFATGLLPLVRSAGRTLAAMTVTVGGLLGNIFLDWLFIQRFQWGLPGAALATGLSQGACALAALPLLLAHKGWPLRLGQFAPCKRMIKGILHYAVSPFGLSISTSAILLITNLRALRYGGTQGVAVYAVLSYVLGSIIPLISGVGDGLQPLVSYARGARDWQGLCHLRRKGLALAVAVAVISGVACFALRQVLPAVFGASPEAAAQGAAAMWTLTLACPFVAVVRFSCSYFCAVGEPLAGGILAYGEPLGAQPLFLFTLPLWLQLEGVWVAYPAAVMLTAAVAVVLTRRHLALLPAGE